jgi:hypothetical protein
VILTWRIDMLKTLRMFLVSVLLAIPVVAHANDGDDSDDDGSDVVMGAPVDNTVASGDFTGEDSAPLTPDVVFNPGTRPPDGTPNDDQIRAIQTYEGRTAADQRGDDVYVTSGYRPDDGAHRAGAIDVRPEGGDVDERTNEARGDASALGGGFFVQDEEKSDSGQTNHRFQGDAQLGDTTGGGADATHVHMQPAKGARDTDEWAGQTATDMLRSDGPARTTGEQQYVPTSAVDSGLNDEDPPSSDDSLTDDSDDDSGDAPDVWADDVTPPMPTETFVPPAPLPVDTAPPVSTSTPVDTCHVQGCAHGAFI